MVRSLSYGGSPFCNGRPVFDDPPPPWPSFALNTLFYAVVLWIPFAPFVLRKALRRKRGLCIKCGYDLRHVEHEVCPECGSELSARTKS